jgi:hypothetical protein
LQTQQHALFKTHAPEPAIHGPTHNTQRLPARLHNNPDAPWCKKTQPCASGALTAPTNGKLPTNSRVTIWYIRHQPLRLRRRWLVLTALTRAS